LRTWAEALRQVLSPSAAQLVIDAADEIDRLSALVGQAELTDELIIAIAEQWFAPESVVLSGSGAEDRRLSVQEYPVCDDILAFARALLAQAIAQQRGEG
jgi:hypothetical protein